MKLKIFLLGSVLLSSGIVFADDTACAENETWDLSMAMCMPRAGAGAPTRKLMIQGNAFGTEIFESGPRGQNAFAVPDWIMADLGTSVGERHYLNLEYMGTAEKWLLPRSGYPELLQVGETDQNGRPFIDHQHPHSSPVMGLTLGDTFSFAEEKSLKFAFSPRGESGDGPIAFMHRPTGMVNPDAPLGHHVGQDVGHVSSTVVAASLAFGGTKIEASVFHGEEPQPTKVDLPLGALDSYALRLVRDLSPAVTVMASAAYVKNPEGVDPTLPFVARYSASVYSHYPIGHWATEHATIFGLITKYDHASTLFSVDDEFTWRDQFGNLFFGRFEFVQRTAAELEIASNDPNAARANFAITGGYTRTLAKIDDAELGLGGSVTHDFLPADFRGAYGGDPWTGKVFLRLSGMKSWDL
jgi:hypothetical protein